MSTNGHETVPPRPVPEAPVGGVAVSDEERNRYGALLDSAAERGLLTPEEYRARLVAVADADSVDDLRRLVTELPAFGGPAVGIPSGRSTGVGVTGAPTAASAPGASVPDVDALLQAGRTTSVARRSGSQWILLALVVAVLLVALVALGFVAAHVAHVHGSTGAVAGVARISSPRP